MLASNIWNRPCLPCTILVAFVLAAAALLATKSDSTMATSPFKGVGQAPSPLQLQVERRRSQLRKLLLRKNVSEIENSLTMARNHLDQAQSTLQYIAADTAKLPKAGETPGSNEGTVGSGRQEINEKRVVHVPDPTCHAAPNTGYSGDSLKVLFPCLSVSGAHRRDVGGIV
eukprot:6194263-Pleurochrysis_carterae.AAC.1